MVKPVLGTDVHGRFNEMQPIYLLVSRYEFLNEIVGGMCVIWYCYIY